MIKVLNHGYVQLVDRIGDDLSVVRAARVSYDAEPRGDGSDEKLIHYLMKNAHTSPFESVVFSFEVKAPIFVFRQWHRHRTWCATSNTPLIFTRPCDNKAYPMSLGNVVKKWWPKEPKRARHERTLKESNRERLSSMSLRSPNGGVQLSGAWFSGVKPVYRLRTKYGEVTASAQHEFKTPEGGARIEDSPTTVMAMVSVGAPVEQRIPLLSRRELQQEQWIEIEDGYEVSNCGRVRTYWGQGARVKRLVPTLKQQTITNRGRQSVHIKSGLKQVSRLVCQAFIGDVGKNQVLHRDDNALDNRVRNLYVGTPRDNSRDQYVNGGRIRLRETPVNVLDIRTKGSAETFDISVTGNHWYCADNLVVHNSYNEVSARYTELNMGFYLPDIDRIGFQSKDNKQMRTDEMRDDGHGICERIRHACLASYQVYDELLKLGVPRELARSVLPVAAYSKMFATVNLHNLFHFLKLRLHPHAQYEIRVYAEALLELITPVVPVCVEAFKEHVLP